MTMTIEDILALWFGAAPSQTGRVPLWVEVFPVYVQGVFPASVVT